MNNTTDNTTNGTGALDSTTAIEPQQQQLQIEAPVVAAVVEVVKIKVKAMRMTKTNLRQAATTFASALANGQALAFVEDGLAFTLEKAVLLAVEGAVVLNKSIFVQSDWGTLLNILRPAQVVVVATRGVPEYVLRATPIADVEIDTKAMNSTTTVRLAGGQTGRNDGYSSTPATVPLEVTRMVNEVTANLMSKYGVTLNITGNRGAVTVPQAETEKWSFVCAGRDIQFPVSMRCADGKLMALTLGHYTVSSKVGGFDAEALEAAVVHCFNLIG